MDAMLAAGEFGPLRDWLREHVHRHGRRYAPAELCRLATGSDLDAGPFLRYLTEKLEQVYKI